MSRPYVDLTAWVLERYGVVLHREKDSWRIPGGQCFAPLPMEQEGDWSAAAYWLVLAALGQGITVTGLRQDSRQGDRRALTLCPGASPTGIPPGEPGSAAAAGSAGGAAP